MEWTAAWVEEVLTAPERVVRQRPWRLWIDAHGGVAALHAHMQATVRTPGEQRLLAALLADPQASPGTLADRLALHRTSIVRLQRRLMTRLAAALNELPPPTAQPYPLPATSIIGRDLELATLADLLSSPTHRLITITGTGGVGKTRLAQAATTAAAAHYPDGVWFVPLAALSAPALLGPTLAQVLGVPLTAGSTLEEALAATLQPRHALLVLDNLEHLLDAVRTLLPLLRAAPRLTILTTSRVLLSVEGEQALVLDPLPTTAATTLPPAALLIVDPAVRLFVARAQAAQATFRLTTANAAAIATLCHELDGLPLALELAAAQSHRTSPQAILGQLRDHRTALQPPAPGLPLRQRTLRATLDWSYALLSPRAQALLQAVGVWAGSWTLAAHAALLPDWTSAALTQATADLQRHHLLQRTEDPDGTVWLSMLATIRAYAQEQLATSGHAAALRTAHLHVMAAWVEPTEQRLLGPDQVDWTHMLTRIYPDIHAALGWSLASGACAPGLAMAGTLWRYWLRMQRKAEGFQWLEPLLQRNADVPAVQRARALHAAGVLCPPDAGGRRLARATTLLSHALASAQAAGDQWRVASILNLMGLHQIELGHDDQGRTLLLASLQIRRQLADEGEIAGSLINLGNFAYERAHYADAHRCYSEALSMFQAVGDLDGIAIGYYNLGVVAMQQERYTEAVAAFTAAMPVREQVAVVDGILTTLDKLALCAVRQERWTDARAFLARWLDLYDQEGESPEIMHISQTIAEWLALWGHREAAHALYDSYQHFRAIYHLARGEPDRRWEARLQRLLAATAGTAAATPAPTARWDPPMIVACLRSLASGMLHDAHRAHAQPRAG